MHQDISEVIEQTLKEFCLDFLRNPYLCYTEHGLHALFYARLYIALPPADRYLTLDERQVCVLQKEYQLLLDGIHGRLHFRAIRKHLAQIGVENGHHFVPLRGQGQCKGGIGGFAQGGHVDWIG